MSSRSSNPVYTYIDVYIYKVKHIQNKSPTINPPPVQVLLSDLIEDPTGKFLKVKYIQKKSLGCSEIPFLFDKGSKVTWVPNGDKLTTSAPGVVLSSYEDEWFGEVRIFIFRLTLCRY